MLKKLARLFLIKTRWEAFAVIYAVAVGACSRGYLYMEKYPGTLGYVFFLVCTAVVFIAGAKILDATPRRWSGVERRSVERRRAR